MGLIAGGIVVIAADSVAVADPSEGYLDDVPSTTPSTLGDIDLTELQYADPAEALGLIQPPTADASGGASLAHPLDIPPGRAGVQPDLALAYDSGGGSGWVGTGWDLSVGAITVDTEFGAPRYLTAKESETYLLDGDRLFPNAIRTTLDARQPGPRSDWVKQLEDDHDLITRHGSSPDGYCWEIADTEGNHRFYGGEPDGNGGCARNGAVIMTSPATGATGGGAGDYHWPLTYVEDISGNTMRFQYEQLTDVKIGQAGPTIGVSLYLKTITYSGFKYTADAPDEPAYRVRFLRDGDIVGETARADVIVDASAGEPVVTRDLLRGVEVDYLSDGFHDGTEAAQLVTGWTLDYINGPFDKALLSRVGQYGTGGRGTEHAWNTFEWFDDVRDDNGNYAGFGPIEQWGNRTDTGLANIAAESALGTSFRGGADGGAYIGFNPIIPSKIGSFGGSFNIAGGQSNEVSTLIDIDGDALPDKVFVSGGTVMYRRNLNTPGSTKTGDSWFGAATTITTLDGIGRSSDLRIDVHFEAYPVVAIQVGGGFGFSFGDEYFEDVNSDGRIDFIKPGAAGAHTVFYNKDVNGAPTFIDSSLADGLAVPLDAFDSDLADAQISEVATLLLNTSPRVDTVRRWVAPHSGTVNVAGTVALTAGTGYQGDGAQVSIEHGGSQRWVEILDASTPSMSPEVEFAVTAGQAVWFRVHVLENAAGDEIHWDPTITYIDGLGGAALTPKPDANGRSQAIYNGAADFTLFGRTGARTAFTEAGTIDITVNVEVDGPGLSDELDITIVHGHGDGTSPTEHSLAPVPQLTPGPTMLELSDLAIAAPTVDDKGTPETDDDIETNDWLEIHVQSDSPVDPTLFSIDVATTEQTLPPPDPGVPPGLINVPLDVPIVPNVRLFASTDRTAAYVPIVSPDQDRMKDASVSVSVVGPKIGDGTRTSDAVLTVKTLAGAVVAKQAFTIQHVDQPIPLPARLEGSASLNFLPVKATDHYIEVSVANPLVGAGVDLTDSTVTWRWTVTEDDGSGNDVDVDKESVVNNAGQLHWPDQDGMFASPNRGWGYAGYNADHADADGGGPLEESQFVFGAETSGYDEDTPIPSAPSASSVKGDVSTSFEPAFPFVPAAGPDSEFADRWRAGEKETLNGRATVMQADRLGADVPIPGGATVGREAPQMLSVDGDFNFMLGLVASFTAAAGGGRALKGYEDYNGDGFPDIRSGASIEYTGPRGAKADTNSAGDNTYDTALALGGGISGSAIAISSSGAASKNDDGGGQGSNVEPTSTKSSRGMNIGLGFSLNSQWTNPIGSEASDALSGGSSDAPDVQGDLTAEGLPGDLAMIDMNGDGLPDRVQTFTSGELWVSLNLGYRFAEAVQWSTGRTAANKDLGGSVTAGFQFNAYEFAGGVSYSEGVGYSLFDWTDIDGDGVPDRMNNVEDGQPETIFGSGNGMNRTAIEYGTYHNGSVALDANRWAGTSIPLPEGQMEVSRSTGLSGGVDFAFYIGPICLVACYIVINPGIHGGYDRMTEQVQMVDMNGDGYLDAVRSTDYEHIEVRLNQRGRTNMLASVTNPLGGQIRLDYERTGNTIANPESVWVMSSVDFDDGRAGDGPSVQRSEFSYDGNVYDPLLRELLGFNSIIEEHVDENGAVVRSFERDYLNANPFETGTMIEERTLDENGAEVQRNEFTWEFVNADPHGVAGDVSGVHGAQVTNLPAVGTPERLALFDTALSPRLVIDRLVRMDGEGDEQTVATRYAYNVIGDVLTVHDENESEITGDDTFTEITYSDCATRSGDRQLGADDSWVSVPQTVTVYGSPDNSGDRMRYRNGGPDLCSNAASVRIAELVAEDTVCGDLFAITELSFDTHGSFNGVAHPSNEVPISCADYPDETVDSADLTFDGCGTLSAEDDAVRYCVDYVFDPHRLTAIAEVTDNHGVSATAAYDPLTGRLASRTDENDNVTTYEYDPQGRLSSIVAPREQGGATQTMTYAYGPMSASFDPAGAHVWATAHHFDRFNDGNTIDTVSFVDGMGRVVQRKRDAVVDGVPGESRIVEGAVEFDALGRDVKEWYPVVETDADFAFGAYNTWNSETATTTTHVPETLPTVREFDVLDRVVSQRLPDGSVEAVAYDFDVLDHPFYSSDNITMSRVVSTDPLGRETSSWLDVGGAVFRQVEGFAGVNDPEAGGNPLAGLPNDDVIESPRIAASVGTPGEIVTLYDYDRLGRLVAVIDDAGARTDHTYDRRDAVTATNTPDGGLVERTFAPSGQLLTVERAVGAVATYVYERDRMVGVDYSDDTPDVTYEYGDDQAADNAAGRVTRVIDGAMDRTYGYDVDGNVARETATEDDNPWGNSVNPNPTTWETTWDYDSLGRLFELTYPDGELLEHDYDLGGRPISLISQAPQHDLYDQYGDAVPRPDTEIRYIDAVRYDEFGEATFVRTGTGVETHYDHEPTRRFLASISTDATAAVQFDGSMSPASPLQRLEYTYDTVGNVRDAVNALYAEGSDTTITQLGPPPVNNVPGPSQHAYTYDGHYRLTGGVGTYIDRQENRGFIYEADYATNGSLLAKRQVTTTTSTTGGGKGKKQTTTAAPTTGDGKGKKGDGSGTDGGTTGEPTCESNTGSGGGSFNQDPETTYVIAVGDLEYDAGTHRLIRSGNRDYTYDANGNMTGWVQPCSGGSADITRTYEWDAENRVTRMAEGNNDTDLRYNAEGARTLERGAGGTTWFVNEHWRTVNDGHRYANVFLGEQLVASHRTSSAKAAPAPCTDTLDDPCACDNGGGACLVSDISECDLAIRVFDPATSTCQYKESRTIHFIHSDLQGSLRVATDQFGKVFQYMDYLPTGRPWVAGQSTIKDTPYLFAGGWTDTTYDLVNFGERWYNPREENFLTPEPLLEEEPYAVVDDPSLLSAYTYASSNPLRYVDPDGRASQIAKTGFKLGKNFKKHEQGDITISVARRENRESPKITFGGRYSNDARGQQLSKAFKKHADRAERFSTILSISTEDGVRKVRVFGITAKETKIAPDPSPGNAGNGNANDSATAAPPTPPPRPAGPPPAPAAQSASDQSAAPAPPNAVAASADAGGPTAAPPDAGGTDAPAPPPPPPRPPAAAAPAADGADAD